MQLSIYILYYFFKSRCTNLIVLVILIGLAFLFYLFYKMKQFRSKRPAERKWHSSKASISLGFFVLLFGINQLFLFKTTTTYVVSAIFIVIGAINIIGGYKLFKYYFPLAAEEADKLD